MVKKLFKNGTSLVLTISPEMRAHLGITNSVKVSYDKGKIVLSKPKPGPLDDEQGARK